MARIEWAPSASKHGIPTLDAAWAVAHYEVTADLDVTGDEVTRLYIGHPHAQALPDDYLEVLASIRPQRIKIFHVMRLSDLYRHLLYTEE